MCKKEGWNLAINIFPDRKYVMYTNECRTQPKWTSSLQKILASAYKCRAPNKKRWNEEKEWNKTALNLQSDEETAATQSMLKKKKRGCHRLQGKLNPKSDAPPTTQNSCYFLSTIDQIIANKLYLHRTYGFSPPPRRKCIHKEKVDSLHLFHAGQNKPYFMKKRI